VEVVDKCPTPNFNPPLNDPDTPLLVQVLSLRVTLRLQEDKPNTHQNVCGGRFMSVGRMEKTQYMNYLTHNLDKQCIGK
jgi:hypothetical protein